MKIYLVRHGQCESNVIGRYNFVNEDINDIGIKQAESLREKIKDIDYDIVISSPLVLFLPPKRLTLILPTSVVAE